MTEFTPKTITDTELSGTQEEKRRKAPVVSLLLALFVGSMVIVAGFLWQQNTPPATFPVNEHFVIEEGQSVRSIAQNLQAANIVRSDTLLYFVVAAFFDARDIKASTYVFDTPLTTYEVAERLTQGDFDTDLIRFTVIEGQRVDHIARAAAEQIPNFDAELFINLAKEYEGTLFPETYFIPRTYSEVELLELLIESFDENIERYQADIAAHPLSIDEIITLASIVEREANSSTSMRIVAGILQNRLDIDMPLQADASLEYAIDTPLNELPEGALAEYIKDLDSPYNTYKYAGLPPTPIGNPGMSAIEAVLQPAESEYLYYITGNDGEFYYAETYTQHVVNIERHLR